MTVMEPLRADARRHRTVLLDTAATVFLEFGITTSLDTVVTRSGLGRATLYRHFPDRAALVLALVDASLDQLEAAVASMHCGVGQWQAIVDQVAAELAINPALADAWRVVDPRSEATLVRQRRFCELCAGPVKAAVQAGSVRPDLEPDDMILIVAMIGTAMREKDETRRKAMIARITELILGGVQAPPRTADE